MVFNHPGIGSIEDNIRHNCRIKIYPDGSREVMVSERAIFREAGWEEVSNKLDTSDRFGVVWEETPAVEKSVYALYRREAAEADRAALSLERAKRRARSAVSDLALSNDFRFFVTLTLDKSKVDRYDVKEITRKLNNWCDNHVRREGLKYVLVAERHADGAVHFHGFFNDALAAVDSGTISMGGGRPRRPRSAKEREALLAAGGHAVYNLPSWSLGFTTAIELYGDRRAAAGYVTKYITKAAEKVGGRWYYSGGALARPVVEYANVNYDDVSGLENCRTFRIDALGCNVVKFTVEADAVEKSV